MIQQTKIDILNWIKRFFIGFSLTLLLTGGLVLTLLFERIAQRMVDSEYEDLREKMDDTRDELATDLVRTELNAARILGEVDSIESDTRELFLQISQTLRELHLIQENGQPSPIVGALVSRFYSINNIVIEAQIQFNQNIDTILTDGNDYDISEHFDGIDIVQCQSDTEQENATNLSDCRNIFQFMADPEVLRLNDDSMLVDFHPYRLFARHIRNTPIDFIDQFDAAVLFRQADQNIETIDTVNSAINNINISFVVNDTVIGTFFIESPTFSNGGIPGRYGNFAQITVDTSSDFVDTRSQYLELYATVGNLVPR